MAIRCSLPFNLTLRLRGAVSYARFTYEFHISRAMQARGIEPDNPLIAAPYLIFIEPIFDVATLDF